LIRILLADDQALIRSGIRSLLEAEDDIEVVAEAADGQQAVALAAEHRPDIALLDIQMPVLDGLEATRQIVADERLDEMRVVILTNFGLDEYIFRALRAGASGFLLKDTEPADLLQALRVVVRGDALLSPAVTRRLIIEFVARPPDAAAAAGMETLTNREREVVALAARPVQRRDRRRHSAQPCHRQDPRQPRDDQARRPRPGAARCLRLPDRPGYPARRAGAGPLTANAPAGGSCTATCGRTGWRCSPGAC
jgi:DNA-binding NarL/FixJ family response regulator